MDKCHVKMNLGDMYGVDSTKRSLLTTRSIYAHTHVH